MLDERGRQNFFRHMHELYIQPEIDRRKAEGNLPDGFQIYDCLIRLPKGQPKIVEFNDEIRMTAIPKLAPGAEIEAEKAVYLHEVVEIERILPPEVDGVRVAFFYIFWNGHSYSAVFDFAPNDPEFDPGGDEFKLGETIANHIQRKITEITVRISRTQQSDLRQIGLWAATSLIPYPISKILERIGEGQLDEARTILVNHCNSDFISELVETWKPINVFNIRIELFREVVFAHRNSRFRLSIYTLIPQIEGIITDWLHELEPPSSVKWKIESKVKQFRDKIHTIPQFDFMYREALESVSEFLLDGPPLQAFTNWLDSTDASFPGRHVVGHGKYDEDIFSEENSIKLFLLLDTICQFMMFYDAYKKSGESNA